MRSASPGQRRSSENRDLLAAQHARYRRAGDLHRQRWSGNTGDSAPVGPVTLNHECDSIIKAHSTGHAIQPLAK
jgi:hypothetical protein